MALPRVLGEIDRRDYSERDGEEHRAENEIDRPEHLRPYPAEEMRIVRFVEQESPVPRETGLQHIRGASLELAEEGLQGSAPEAIDARFQYFDAHLRGIGVIVFLGEENPLELDLRAIPSRLSVLLAHENRLFPAGHRTEELHDETFELLKIVPVAAAEIGVRRVELRFESADQIEHRPASRLRAGLLGLDLGAVAAIESVQHELAILNRGAEHERGRTLDEYGTEKNDESEGHEHD